MKKFISKVKIETTKNGFNIFVDDKDLENNMITRYEFETPSVMFVDKKRKVIVAPCDVEDINPKDSKI